MRRLFLIQFLLLFSATVCANNLVPEDQFWKDRDGDGVRDRKDKCPDTPGLKEFDGCPDSDSDGIEDAKDDCPFEYGLKAFNGCPDTDGDGFSDKEDFCPDLAGIENYNGCPDSDLDGVMDSKDDCPNEKGLIENKGCPIIDDDGDGVADEQDQCVGVKGSADCEGCACLNEVVRNELMAMARSIQFKSGKSTIDEQNKAKIAKLYSKLIQYQPQEWIITGHTDSSGHANTNLKLSFQRAQAVANELISLGWPSESLKVKGMGEDLPIASNKTIIGRNQNRRIELEPVVSN